jgi:HD-like signal output (HDOD) protein
LLQATAGKPDKGRVLAAIASKVRDGEISFPTTAQMALRISEALGDPDCASGTATRLIAAEPLLAARIVGLANSALYPRPSRAITDLSTAIARVGFSAARSLATALVLRQMANAPANPAHRAFAAQLWDHTTRMAALASVLARRVTGQNPDTVLFAGLVHEVGGFYLVSRAAEYPQVLEARRAHDGFYDVRDADGKAGDDPSGMPPDFESRIGRAVLELLAVPAPVVEAVETLWLGYLTLPPSTLGDTLLLADQLVAVRSPFELSQEDDAPHAYANLDVAFDDVLLSDMLKEASADIEALAAILKG